jgi:serine/threonine-protein kinase
MDDLIGTTVAGHYQVVKFVGRGGMADVYKVWDTQRSVFLAMKVLREDLAEDDIFLRRFQRESETLARLQHPHIIRSYGLIQTGNLAFLLMDFIEGSTLRKEIFSRKAPWTPAQILEIVRPVCAALNFAHSQGLVHCDVKPANIMITSKADVLVADFGIARLTESATTATLVGAGTPAYMAPEQIRGEDPQPQTDIYALGIVLFELLTGGARPFTGEYAQTTGSSSEKVRWEQLYRTSPSVREFNPAVPGGVEAVVFKCLEKDPARRYASAMEVLAALERAYSNVNDVQTVARSVPVPPLPVEQRPILPQPKGPLPPVVPPVPPPYQPIRSENLPKQSRPWWLVAVILGVMAVVAAFAFPSPPAILVVVPTVPPSVTSSVTPSATLTLTPIATSSATPMIVSTVTSTVVSTATPTITPPATSTVPPRMALIPAGAFQMGSNQSDNEKPIHTVTLSAFLMDVYEVTNADYAKCVAAKKCSLPWNLSSYTRSDYYSNGKYVNYPVIYVDWHQATAYCLWAGKRMPTEAEWEKAARGGLESKLYPWGDTPPVCITGVENGAQFSNCSVRDTVVVGSFNPNGYGLYDMAGNAWEWVNDWYSESYYRSPSGNNPTGPTSSNLKVLRGGDWYGNPDILRVTNRYYYDPAYRDNFISFRCAATLKSTE